MHKRRAPKHTKTFFRLSPEDYTGLHQRYAKILQTQNQTQNPRAQCISAAPPSNLRNDPSTPLTLSTPLTPKKQEKLTKLFDNMMRTLHKQQGATFRIEILTEPTIQKFINTHADTLDSAFRTIPMSDAMRRRLQRSDYIFSGIKTFHQLNQAFPSLLNTDGTRKPFQQFLDEVRHIDTTYNKQYLAAEYNFAQASAAMAAKWEQYTQDGDRYLLQYRTAGDDRVRPEHASLEGVTLPITDTFWQDFYPPNGWNCRCDVVQVLAAQATPTPHDQAIALGEDALKIDPKGIFRHNSGITGKTFPDYNPYTIRRCRDCDIAHGKLDLSKPTNQVCEACRIVRKIESGLLDEASHRAEIKKAKDSLEQWCVTELPTVQIKKWVARRFVVTASDGDEIIINRNFYNETITQYQSDALFPIKTEYAKKVHEFIKTAKLVDSNEKSNDHPDAFFKVYETFDDCYRIEMKVRCIRDGNFMHIMRVYKRPKL